MNNRSLRTSFFETELSLAQTPQESKVVLSTHNDLILGTTSQSLSEPEFSKKTNKEDRICILGGGPGGIGAALALKEKGYKNVVVYEQYNKVGGQALSKTFYKVNGKGFVYELCSIQPLGSNHLNKIIKKYNFKYKPALRISYYSLSRNKLVFSTERLKLIAFFIKDPFFLIGIFKFLYFTIKYRFLKKPGLLAYKHSSELTVPYKDWIRKHTLYSLDFVNKYTILGLKNYHKVNIHKIPALYCWKFMYQCLHRPVRYINGVVKLLDEGYQNLWERASEDVDVRLNARIKKITEAITKSMYHLKVKSSNTIN